MEVFNNELHDHLNNEFHECSVCGTEIEYEKIYCSGTCFEADQL